ncbi:FadR/GntR family transcriptional regulator [Pseudonocardia kunmingensis]|uniref:DNA-binding FadR family transcriptional regulator n=1 Tax=Pseudonocardia kunmingensis TaxID=630975 RepID=A0A543DVM7_9PSEU|nr:FCD domain-containing protein [Pseudonocardia kunmingensis]TQM13380.1 DNA-binding FadR family transcriptional regulator [Pseudonocardia kunmingensis]
MAIPRTGLVEALSRHTLRLIEQDGLQPGDRLPSMKALAERFDVATQTMREALQRLEANGAVEIRHGSGIYVRNGRERMVMANRGYGEIEASTVLDLLDARLLIEPHLAGLAAAAHDRTPIAAVEVLLRRAQQHLSGDDEILHDLNMRFHCSLAALSGNRVLAQTIESYVELYSFEQLAVLSFYDNEGRPRDQHDHHEILAAVREGDPVKARDLMHAHLLGVRTYIAERIDAELTRPAG